MGDRYEAYAAASAAHLHLIPIVHLHGGETTLGAVDDKLRHAITQLSTWHFTSPLYMSHVLSQWGILQLMFLTSALWRLMRF